MIITAWFIFIFYGLFTLWTMIQYYFGNRSLNWIHASMWFLSALVTALSAGVIWGGLWNVG